MGRKYKSTPIGEALTKIATFLDDYFDFVATTGSLCNDSHKRMIMCLYAICYRKRVRCVVEVGPVLEYELIRKDLLNWLEFTGSNMVMLTEFIDFIRPVPELWEKDSAVSKYLMSEFTRLVHKARCELVMWYVSRHWPIRSDNKNGPLSKIFDFPLWKPSKMNKDVMAFLLEAVPTITNVTPAFIPKLCKDYPELQTPYRNRRWSEADVPERLKSLPY